MSDSPLAREFEELLMMSELSNTELRPDVDFSLTQRDQNDRLPVLLTDMLGNGSDDFNEYGYSTTGVSALTFDADFIPNWGAMESDHPPSSAASSSSLNYEQTFSPNQSFTSETSSDVDGSPLQFFSDQYRSNASNPTCSPPTPSSIIPSAFSSPAIHSASVHPSPAIFQALSFTCTVCSKTYKTKNNLQRHRRDAQHGPGTPSPLFVQASPAFITSSGHSTPMIPLFPERKLYECPHPNCQRKGENGFPRKDNMVQHQRLVHNAHLPKRERRKVGQKSRIAKK